MPRAALKTHLYMYLNVRSLTNCSIMISILFLYILLKWHCANAYLIIARAQLCNHINCH